jgi:hypothetical protein
MNHEARGGAGKNAENLGFIFLTRGYPGLFGNPGYLGSKPELGSIFRVRTASYEQYVRLVARI